MPSAGVANKKLLASAQVLAKYPKLLVTNKVPNLAMKFAQVAYFGDVMARVLARICIPSGSWVWSVGTVTRTMISSIEYLGTFAGENFLNWLK